jgi:hypothetical protein
LPKGITGHWGSTLRSYILYQYHHQHVTQPLLLEQLHNFGIDISSGQLNNMITENLDDFHDEKDMLLQADIKYALNISKQMIPNHVMRVRMVIVHILAMNYSLGLKALIKKACLNG